MAMYLPAQLREELKARGVEAPPDGTEELDRWIVSLRRENPEVYALVVRYASASAPPLDSEHAEERARKAGRLTSILRRAFVKKTAAGDRVTNRKLITFVVLGGAVTFLLILMMLSAMSPGPKRKEASAPAQQVVREKSEEQVKAPPRQEEAAPGPQPQKGSAGQEIATPPAARSTAGPVPVGQGSPTVSSGFPPVPQLEQSGGVAFLQEPQAGQGGSGVVVYDRSPAVQPASIASVVYERQSRTAAESSVGSEPSGIVVFDANASSAGKGSQQAQVSEQGQSQTVQGRDGKESASKEMAVAVRFMPGQKIEGRLATGIVAVDGAQPVPVVVTSGEGTWLGAAQLGPGGRVQVALQQVISGGMAIPVQAIALDKQTQAAGLVGRVRTVNPKTAQALVAGIAQGVADYMKAVANSQTTTITNGWITVTSGPAGPWWAYILGGLSGQIPQLVPQGSSPVTIVEIEKDTPVTVLVLAQGTP